MMQIQKFEFLAFDKITVPLPAKPEAPLPQAEEANEVTAPEVEEDIPQEPEIPAAPLITEAMVEEAKKAGYDQGFQEGYDKAKSEIDAEQNQRTEALTAVLEQCKLQLATLQQSQPDQQAIMQSETIKLAVALAKKMAADTLKDNALAIIENIATKAVQLMHDTPHLTLLVHPDLIAQVESEIGRLTKDIGYRGVLMVGALSAQSALTDCQVSWSQGRLFHDTKQLWQEIEQLLENYTDGKTELPIQDPIQDSVPSEPLETPAEDPENPA